MKKYSVILFLLIFFLTIGTATANQINETDFVVNNIDSSTHLNKSWDDLKSAIENTNEGSTLYLNGSIYKATTDSHTIFIDKNITINGGFENGSVVIATIDGNNLNKIIKTTANIKILNVHFINWNTTTTDNGDFGGIISSSGESLALFNCFFTENIGFSDFVFLDYGNLSLVDCFFVNCSVNGSFVFLGSGCLDVLACIFVNDFGSSDFVFLDSGNLSLVDCFFVNCSVEGSFVFLGSGNLSLVDCFFVNCSVEGSFVFLGSGCLDVLACIFVNDFGSSDFVFLDSGYLSLVDCFFVNCSVEGSFVFLGSGYLNVLTCIFRKNSVFSSSFISLGSGNLTVLACIFAGNSVSSSSFVRGGFVFLGSGNLSLVDCFSINNRISSSDFIEGGFVFLGSGNLTMLACVHINSQVSSSDFIDGGFVFAIFGNLTIVDSFFVNTSFSSNSFRSFVFVGSGNLTIVDSFFAGNSVLSLGFVEGGIVYMKNGSLSIFDCIFIGNNISSNSFRGFVFVGSGNLTIVDSFFAGNSVLSLGFVEGGIVYMKNGSLSVLDGNFLNNSFYSQIVNGSTIYINLGNLVVFNSNFIKNQVQEGNVIYIRGNASIVQSMFRNNNVHSIGEVIYFTGQYINITNSQFFSNDLSTIQIYISKGNASFNSNEFFNCIPIKISQRVIISSHTFIMGDNVTGKINSIIPINIKFTDDALNQIIFDNDVEITINETKIKLKHDEDSYVGYYSPKSIGIKQIDYDKFTNLTSQVQVIVTKNDNIIINANPVVMYKGNGSRLHIVVSDCEGKPLDNYDLTILINSVYYNKTTNSEGVITIGLNGLSPNTYNVSLYCKGINGTEIKTNTVVTVLSTIILNNLTKMYNNESQLLATLLNSEGQPSEGIEASFNIDGVFYKRISDNNGSIKLNINLRPGEYIVTLYNNDSGENKSIIVTVLSNIISSNITKYYKNNTQYCANILDDKTNSVKEGVKAVFNINGVFYDGETDNNGTVKLNINLRPGVYIITIMVNGLNQSNSIIVLSTINSTNIEMTTSNRKSFNITVLSGKGVPEANVTVKFNINGVFYNKTTDVNGIASLDINLMAGSYIITSILDNGLMQSNTIIVKD